MTSLHRLIALLVVWAAFAFVGFYTMGSSLFIPSTTVALLLVVEIVAALFATWLIARVRSV